jgi:hypothetical protein
MGLDRTTSRPMIYRSPGDQRQHEVVAGPRFLSRQTGGAQPAPVRAATSPATAAPPRLRDAPAAFPRAPNAPRRVATAVAAVRQAYGSRRLAAEFDRGCVKTPFTVALAKHSIVGQDLDARKVQSGAASSDGIAAGESVPRPILLQPGDGRRRAVRRNRRRRCRRGRPRPVG